MKKIKLLSELLGLIFIDIVLAPIGGVVVFMWYALKHGVLYTKDFFVEVYTEALRYYKSWFKEWRKK